MKKLVFLSRLTLIILMTGATPSQKIWCQLISGPMIDRSVTPFPDKCGDSLHVYGNGYTIPTVQIGHQCWMAKNMNVGNIYDFDVIKKELKDNGYVEKFCYDDDEWNCDDGYGGLYTWNEAMQYDTAAGTQGICPKGWHIPTENDWYELITYLGGEKQAGGKMKSKDLWEPPNTGATNESGFSAVPSGVRWRWSDDLTSIDYDGLGFVSYFWSSSRESQHDAVYIELNCENEYAVFDSLNKNMAFSVRCVKD